MLSPNVTPQRATEIIDSLHLSYKAQFKRNPSVDMVISAQSGPPAASKESSGVVALGGESARRNAKAASSNSPMVYSVIIRLPDNVTPIQENDTEWLLNAATETMRNEK